MKNFEQNNLNELRENISQQQSGTYAETLVRLMERSGDNPELVNALRDFIKEIDIKSLRGVKNEPMEKSLVVNLTRFFKEKSEELKRLV